MPQSLESLQSELKALKAKVAVLEDSHKQLQLVIKSTGVGIWDWNIKTGETVFNERWANMVGYTLAELAPVSINTWLNLAHPKDLKESERLLKAHWAGESEYYLFESRMQHKAGHWIWVYDTGQVIEWDSDGSPLRMIGTHLDITDKKRSIAELDEANKKLLELSYIDPLTQLPNRRAYEKRLELELFNSKRADKPLSLLVIDVDYFKSFNDTYGHEQGDMVLYQVAQAIQAGLHRATDFAARFGGEEFVVILPDTGEQGAENVAKTILAKVKALNIKACDMAAHPVLTVSIGGVASCDNYQCLFENADQALYQAKDNGRDQYQLYVCA